MPTLCRICETRRPRRYCPGLGADICAPCCGAEREVSVDCPFDCEHLIEARKHERPPLMSQEQLPNPDVRVTEQFLRDRENLLLFLAVTVREAAKEVAGAVDFDVREALDAQIRTYRTSQSGLIYETRPANPCAAAVHMRVRAFIDEYRKAEVERSGLHTLRDADVLGVLVFLQRVEVQENNGRRRGRAFLDFLRTHFPARAEPTLVEP